MIPFNFTTGDDDGDFLEPKNNKKFSSCETSDECYICTGRIVLDFQACQIKDAPNVVNNEETILLCVQCIQYMLCGISYNPIDAVSWETYLFNVPHPDSRN